MKSYTLQHDGSFEGFLSTIFEIYAQRIEPGDIEASGMSNDIFQARIVIKTDISKAERVMKGLLDKSSKAHLQFLHRCFLSEEPGVEMKLLHPIRKILRGKAEELKNYADPVMMHLHTLYKKVGRETHRMHAFVRFQELKDGLFVSMIQPDFNVLPLIGYHFRERYPGMRWFIYDLSRKYGLYHENRLLTYRTLENSPIKADRRLSEEILAEGELEFQDWWRAYFKSVNIPERRNDRLHRQHVPKRYWPFLIEKTT